LENYVGTESEGLFEHWHYLTQKEKGILVEQICEKIVVGKTHVHIDFTYSPEERHVALTPETDESIAVPKPNEIILAATSINEPLLNEKDAAKFLGVSKMTILRRRNAGEIGFYQDGPRIKYSKEKHLLPYLAGRERGIGGGT